MQIIGEALRDKWKFPSSELCRAKSCFTHSKLDYLVFDYLEIHSRRKKFRNNMESDRQKCKILIAKNFTKIALKILHSV